MSEQLYSKLIFLQILRPVQFWKTLVQSSIVRKIYIPYFNKKIYIPFYFAYIHSMGWKLEHFNFFWSRLGYSHDLYLNSRHLVKLEETHVIGCFCMLVFIKKMGWKLEGEIRKAKHLHFMSDYQPIQFIVNRNNQMNNWKLKKPKKIIRLDQFSVPIVKINPIDPKPWSLFFKLHYYPIFLFKKMLSQFIL